MGSPCSIFGCDLNFLQRMTEKIDIKATHRMTITVISGPKIAAVLAKQEIVEVTGGL